MCKMHGETKNAEYILDRNQKIETNWMIKKYIVGKHDNRS
jgi:hypothetical protein